MKFVVEFEGYQLQGRFIFKELVICNLSSSIINHFFIKPPFHRELLSASDERIVKYCEKFLHKIQWHSGSVHMKEVVQFLSNLPESCVVYTKGRNKAKLLSSMFKKFQVINLEDEGCPPITKLLLSSETECPLAFHKDTLNCAHLKAHAFSVHIQNRQ